ncbi:MAG: hypothetical protein MZU84_09570 [Sphingobacterium sp.]|nr:hypothetical protein [Sphingobacterium sp.]
MEFHQFQTLSWPVAISTLKSTVIQVKKAAKNETIGYNRKGKATEDMTVAIVPVSYADGLNRRLSNGNGKLYITGHIVPIVGNICMDMCMADITNCNIKEGDEVIIFGKELPVTEMANALQTIPYEIFTRNSTGLNEYTFRNNFPQNQFPMIFTINHLLKTQTAIIQAFQS